MARFFGFDDVNGPYGLPADVGRFNQIRLGGGNSFSGVTGLEGGVAAAGSAGTGGPVGFLPENTPRSSQPISIRRRGSLAGKQASNTVAKIAAEAGGRSALLKFLKVGGGVLGAIFGAAILFDMVVGSRREEEEQNLATSLIGRGIDPLSATERQLDQQQGIFNLQGDVADLQRTGAVTNAAILGEANSGPLLDREAELGAIARQQSIRPTLAQLNAAFGV